MFQTRMEFHQGRLLRCYAQRPANVDEMLRASFARDADSVALVEGSERLSYGQLDNLADWLAAGLAARGVGRGDRVAVMLANGIDMAITVAALVRLGAILVPIGTRLRQAEIAFIFDDAEPVAVVHGAAFAAELPPTGPAADMRFAPDTPGWAALLTRGDGAGVSVAEIAEHDVFGILYTSGTTGRPKGALLTHLNVVHSCLHWQEVHRLGRGDRTALCVPWSHVAGLCGVVLPFLSLGGTLVLIAEFQRRAFLEIAQQERVTHALMVPAMYALCLLEPDLTRFDLRDWRLGVYGSAPMPEPTIRRFAHAFPNLRMCNAYGATETTSPATIMPPEEGIAHAESIGRCVPCGDIRVMDEQGRELPAGTEGELWIAGPMVVPGYWRNDEADTAAFAAGYWKSGDVGAIDADGFVRIADRKKDMINRGGFKVYPAEVESVLTALEGVVEAAVVGQPDEIMGERVVAFVNTVADLDESQVRAFCAERMADYKVPGRVVIGRSPLPRNANGKIQKAELRELARMLPAVQPEPRPPRVEQR